MLIPPKYILTPHISELLSSIVASREVINAIQIPPEIEVNIRRQSTLRSSLYSARIEGNDLTLEDLNSSPSRNQKRLEVFNILKALNWINQRKFRDLTVKDILEFHRLVMGGLLENAFLGKTRSQVSAIFNAAGIAIYMPPPPKQVHPFLEKLVKYINSPRERFTPIKAVLAHFAFEKIHPFLDGNGRVGRLVIQAILAREGYDMKGLLSVEEYLDKHRSEYYRSLEESERDVTSYVEFMLEAIAETALTSRQLVQEKDKLEAEDYLLPRRAEIFRIAKDHKLINFDTIRRRFANVNERTLRFDLKKLQDQGLIRKLGTTNGVYYEPTKV